MGNCMPRVPKTGEPIPNVVMISRRSKSNVGMDLMTYTDKKPSAAPCLLSVPLSSKPCATLNAEQGDWFRRRRSNVSCNTTESEVA